MHSPLEYLSHPTLSRIDTRASRLAFALQRRFRNNASWELGLPNREIHKMMYRSMVLVVAALSSVQASAADLQSVYVAPGGVYIASARVFVAPGVGSGQSTYVEPAPTYAPGYVAPG